MLLSLLAPRPATAGDITNFRTARRLAAVALPIDKVTTRSSEPIAILLCTVTAYSPTVEECDASPLVTASGKRVYVGGIAADLRVLPFGSIVIIPGYNGGNPCTVIDTGSLIRGKTLDVFMWSTEDARQWGRRRNVEVRVLYVPKRQP
jgi:3D (Asp-Asp-Asp) domain-containing protein